MVVVLISNQSKEATMFRASVGGGDASHTVYRHALVRVVSPLLAPLAIGKGWSALSLALAATLMSWDPAPTLAQRFEAVLALLDAALPRRKRVGRTYQGFVKALTPRSEAILGTLVPHLRSLSEKAAGACWRFGEFIAIGADGSRFDAPRTIGNEPLGLAGKDRCGPQMMTLLLVHLGVMLPWAWRIGNARDAERTLLRDLLDELPGNTLLVADAGFTGFDLLCELCRRRMSFLVRVGRGVRLLSELGYYRREGRSTVYLWPKDRKDCAPLVLRLIRVGSVYLITDVTDPRRLSRGAAGELYRRRWGVEVAFRTLKQTLEHHKVRSGAAAHARVELAWAIAGLWVLGLLGVRAITARGHGPRRLSVGAVLTAVRHAARDPDARRTSDRPLRQRLARAVLDEYRRARGKASYQWARKKRNAPPGAPTVTRATAEQVRAAQRVRVQSEAA